MISLLLRLLQLVRFNALRMRVETLPSLLASVAWKAEACALLQLLIHLWSNAPKVAGYMHQMDHASSTSQAASRSLRPATVIRPWSKPSVARLVNLSTVRPHIRRD